MNDPIDPVAALTVTGDGAAGDAVTAVVRQLPPTSCDRPAGAAVGAPIARLSSYRRCDVSGSRWRFTGRVEQVAGVGAERLRGELAVVVRDLLAWAADHPDAGDCNRSETGLMEDGEAA